MFCEKCGAKIPDGAKSCANCGFPINLSAYEPQSNPPVEPAGAENKTPPMPQSANNAPAAGPAGAGYVPPAPPQGPNGAPVTGPAGTGNMPPVAPGYQPGPVPMQPAQSKPLGEKIKALPKWIWICCAAAVAVLLGLIILIIALAAGGKTINLDKYLKIETSGYNGYGTASATIDWTQMKSDYGSKIRFSDEASKNALVTAYNTPFDVLRMGVSVSFDKSSTLSNGDEIAYEWLIDEDLYNYLNVKLKYKNGTHKVKDLKEVEGFDAFAELEVSFTGVAPGGRVELKYNGKDLSVSDFSADKSSGLSNGDKVTISLSESAAQRCLSNIGKMPAPSSKEYTVSGLSEYVAAFTDLSADFVAKLKSEAEDTITAYCAKDYDSKSSMTGLTYAGYIMNIVKDGSSTSYFNNLYVIYKGTVANSENSFRPATVYYPVHFRNVLKEGDTFSYAENEGIVGDSEIDGRAYTRGYVNPLQCYMELVDTAKDEYNVSSGDGFEVFGKHDDIAQLSDISEDYRAQLYADAKDIILSYIAESYNKTSVTTDPVVKGEYLLTAKTQGSDYKQNNRFIIVYAVNVSSTEKNFAPATVYFPVEYDGIVKLPDGTYMVTESAGIQGQSDFPDSSYYTAGYIVGQEMFSQLVTANREQFKYEVSDGLKEFGE